MRPLKKLFGLDSFHFFRDRVKNWLNFMPHDSITNWEDLVHKFLAKFFHPSKTA